MAKEIPFIHRDISWLYFNYRVLQEAKDKSVPLFEKIKFLAIYSSNLEEFFRVRVAGIKNLVRVGKKTKKELDFKPDEVLKEILKLVNKQQDEFSFIFEKNILPELAKHNIYIHRRKKLNEEQREYIEDYFKDNMFPFVQPILLVDDRIKPFLINGALYLALELYDNDKKKDDPKYAIVQIPSDHLPRFISLPSSTKGSNDLIILDDIVRHCVRWIFPGYFVADTYSIKLTRDAELYIDDEYSGDLVSKIKKSLNKRDIGPASRLVYDREMAEPFLQFLMSVFDLDTMDLLIEGRYHNNKDFFKLPDFGMIHLKDKPLLPLPVENLEYADSIFEAIDQEDRLVHVPYQSYESVIKFFEDAANDPDVTHIKILQYRVARESRIMDALMRAVKNKKQVYAFIEIKARFDEEANLRWGEKLEKAGVKVHYSMPGLKVHSKMALVRRKVYGKPKIYCYLSTGNFNEDTATIYSDMGLFTADRRLSREVTKVFSFLENKRRPKTPFKHLLVGQFELKPKLIALIKEQISLAKKGQPASITLKQNSLQDSEMIGLLYKAGKAGVSVNLIIRGICCLVPGIKGESDNINVISIVDRFLEHARVFIFGEGKSKKMFLSSADWMVRNLHHRVETIFPIYNEKIKENITHLLQIQFEDNTKSRLIHVKNNNAYKTNSLTHKVRSQLETYLYIQRLQQGIADPEKYIV